MPLAALSQEPVTFESIRVLAASRASKPYADRRPELPPFWKGLSVADYHKILTRAGHGLWAGEKRNYEVEFFHPGGQLEKTVAFAEVTAGTATEVPWRPEYFDYQNLPVPPETPVPAGYAGFRVLAPLNEPGRMEEMAAFLGGSFFRAVAPGVGWSTSARGLAINPGQSGAAEEFPYFERFWMEKPAESAKALTFYALLDSPSAAGAYKFSLSPGRATVIAVEAEVTFRQQTGLAGYVALSSMHWYNELTHPKPVDYRPEVHNADGLLIQYGDDNAMWRVLDASRTMRHSIFSIEKVLGWGLIQRDREFEHYQDLDANYQNRASVFVEPVGTWPAGRIHLMELPTGEDSWDNVVCLWEPATVPRPGQPLRLSYRLHWLAEMSVPGLSKVLGSRRSHHHYRPEEKRTDDELFVIDFGPGANPQDDQQEPVVAVEVGSGGTLVEKRAQKNGPTGGWRAFFRIRAEEKATTIDLACRLLRGGRPVSEKWTYVWKKD